MISDTPGRGGGGGGSKRAHFCGRPLWMAPIKLPVFCIFVKNFPVMGQEDDSLIS